MKCPKCGTFTVWTGGPVTLGGVNYCKACGTQLGTVKKPKRRA